MDAQFEQRFNNSLFYVDGAAYFISTFTARRGTHFLLDTAWNYLSDWFNRFDSSGIL